MMFDFSAVVITFLGISFLMLYACNMLRQDGNWFIPLRVFMFFISIFFMFMASGFAQQIVDTSLTGNHDAAGWPTEGMVGNMTLITTTGVDTMRWVLYGSSVWLVIAILIISVMSLFGIANKKQTREFEE